VSAPASPPAVAAKPAAVVGRGGQALAAVLGSSSSVLPGASLRQPLTRYSPGPAM
jgi:hypothetical protein